MGQKGKGKASHMEESGAFGESKTAFGKSKTASGDPLGYKLS